MKSAFIYAGQGTQKVGMGRDLYGKSPSFAKGFDNLDKNLQRLCFEGPESILSLTANTQPCMMAFAIGVTDMLKEAGVRPHMAAGLSLGEYSALYCAGALRAKQAVNLVAFRGRIMTEASAGIKSKMVAVLGLDRETISECCEAARAFGVAEAANYNCTGQIVIGGDEAGVDHATDLAMEKGAKRCLPLNVSGPFHTSYMKPAGERLRRRLEDELICQLALPVIFNATAKPLQDNETVPELLERQIQESVRFEDTIRYMASEGIDTIIEIGPGKTLSSFVKKTCGDIRVFSVEDMQSFEDTIAALQH